MKITEEIVQKTAHLARLKFQPEDEKGITKDLQKMIDWVDKLQEVDTEGIEPLTHMTSELDRFRNDEANNQLSQEQGLKNAPKHDSTYFRVPKVIK